MKKHLFDYTLIVSPIDDVNIQNLRNHRNFDCYCHASRDQDTIQNDDGVGNTRNCSAKHHPELFSNQLPLSRITRKSVLSQAKLTS